MREIKFRAFDDGLMIYSHNNDINTNNFQLKWFFERIREDSILMQYTEKKDKKGKEIYEGDVDNFNWIICFESGVFCLKQKLNSKTFIPLCDATINEIIGNIYENPELLK